MSLSHISGFQSFLNDSVAPVGPKKEHVWCEQAVWTLLNVYEEKWRQLDWGNLKGRHWEEVAASLSKLGGGQWPAKSPMQCKNKIEDMKKKYKEKAQKGGPSSLSSKWPYFSRMDVMFKSAAKGVTGLDNSAVLATLVGNSNGTSGRPAEANDQANLASSSLRYGVSEQEFDEGNENEDYEDEGEQESEDEELSFSANCKRKAGGDMPGRGVENNSKQHRKGNSYTNGEVVNLLRSFGESLVRIESSKLEGHRQLIEMQMQAEARRMDMEMKRTEMFMNAHLQLAKMISDSMKNNRKATTVASASAEDATPS